MVMIMMMNDDDNDEDCVCAYQMTEFGLIMCSQPPVTDSRFHKAKRINTPPLHSARLLGGKERREKTERERERDREAKLKE